MLYQNHRLAHSLKIFLLWCPQTSKCEYHLIYYCHSDLGICRMDRMVSTWFHNVDGCETGLMLPTLIDRCDTLLLLSQRRREGCYCYLKYTMLNKLVRQYPNYILIFISKNLCNQIFGVTVSIFYGRRSTWRFWFLGDGSAMIIHMEFFTFVDKVVPFNLCVSCIAIVCGSVMINMIMVVIITHHLWYNHKKTPCTTWFLVFFLIDTCLLYYILICYISLFYDESGK